MRVTIDFDGTLTKKFVQQKVSHLISECIDVWILTARYDEENKHLYKENPTNEDLYLVADKLGIDREKIIFTNARPKSEFLKENEDIIFHLDDSYFELECILEDCHKTVGFSVFENWFDKGRTLLGI